jgi:hypothetical protein
MRENAARRTETLPTPAGVDGHHTCTECPVCGTEECRVLMELGMACDTAQAATEAAIDREEARPAFRTGAGTLRGARRPVS